MEYRITASPAFCRTVNYWAEGTSAREEKAVSLLVSASSREALAKLTAVRVGDYASRLDFANGTVHYPGFHTDPLFVFEREGRACVDLTVYGGEVGDRAELERADGGIVTLPVHQGEGVPEEAAFESRLERLGPGQWVLDVETTSPVEVIWQKVSFGAFRECIVSLPAGRHVLAVPAAFAEYLGVCVSGGSAEHKHRIFGHIGMGSGRHVLDAERGVVLHPRGGHGFRYQAAVVAVPDAEALERLLPDLDEFDEVEVFTPAGPDAMMVRERAEAIGVPHKVTTFGRAMDADVVVVDPAVPEVPDRSFSYMLFAGAGAPGFAERTAAACRRTKALPPGIPVLDRSWVCATLEATIQADRPHYGIAFSRPPAELLDRASLRRAQVAEAGRKLRRSSPCRECPAAVACADVLPFPWPGSGMLPSVGDGICSLREALA